MKILIFSILMITTVAFNAMSQDTIYLWQDTVPGESEDKHPPVISENNSGEVTRFSNITNPALVVFRPSDSIRLNAGIIVCPGGGYTHLAINIEGYEVAQWLNSFGITAYVLQYRVPNKREGALQDIQRAIRVVRNNEINQTIGVMGFSAGGSLSARASVLFNKNSYPAIDRVDSLSSRPDFAVLIYPAYLDLGENRTLTAELTIKPDTPPFFLFGCADDSHGNSCLVMASALRDNKIPAELHFLAEGGHGYGLRKGNKAAKIWPPLLKEWLKKFIAN